MVGQRPICAMLGLGAFFLPLSTWTRKDLRLGLNVKYTLLHLRPSLRDGVSATAALVFSQPRPTSKLAPHLEIHLSPPPLLPSLLFEVIHFLNQLCYIRHTNR